ncbi:DUF4189 domain-containing protein [Actinoallomurus sp. CA-150999]|uniref:DUF4189 domain-containing protein n=1 Tax=Actinoallomurus sp. CA-150999 TaxID=3239887 RepID=UPI003D8F2507
MQPPQPPYGAQPPSYGPPPGGPPGPPGPPGWGPPGPPQRPNNNAAVVIIVVVAALVLLIGGGGILLLAFDASSSGHRIAAASPTVPDFPTPPTYSPPAMPSYTPYSPPDTYSPPPQHWGAIAVASDGSTGKAWDYTSSSAAQRRAMNECPRSSCKVLTTFVNGCGAVAYNSRTNRYWGGHGDTRSEAESNAISNAGGGRWITWVCTTR